MKKAPSSKRGFSLVEVALALGICSFCMVTLIGFIPLGLLNFQNADNQSAMANIATNVTQDLATTPAAATSTSASTKSPFYSLVIPAPNGQSPSPSATTVFVDASGALTSGLTSAGTVYRITVTFTPPAVGSKLATIARVQVTFPAYYAPSTGRYATILQTMVSLNRN